VNQYPDFPSSFQLTELPGLLAFNQPDQACTFSKASVLRGDPHRLKGVLDAETAATSR
jgi:hypothetical protein